jgi:hypothetical protein
MHSTPSQSMTWLSSHHLFLSLEPNSYCLALVNANFSGVVSDATDLEQFFLSRALSSSGAARRFCEVLVPSPWPGQGDIRFLFCKVIGPVNRRENWKLWRDVVKTLIISDTHCFHGLIIKPFDNQTVSLPWLSRISDTSENKSVRLDSDDQINISRLISCLGWFKVFVSTLDANPVNRATGHLSPVSC